MQLQEVVLQEVRSGVNILQAQDNQIVQEANSIFEAHKNELEAISKRVTKCDGQILAIKGTNIGIQRSLKDMNSKIQKVNEVLQSIKKNFKEDPSRRELEEHATAMDEQEAQVQEVNMGLTTAMERLSFRNPHNTIFDSSKQDHLLWYILRDRGISDVMPLA
jgi:predicted  nucleic acid-binding Zn-ribbon protein